MFETVTVDEAISKGKKAIGYPVAAIIFGTITIGFFLAALQIVPFFVIWIAIPAAILSAWVYWRFAVTKWRLWAFENVRNVHELQRKALESSLISREGSFSERTEYRSATDKEKWASLQAKFDLRDVYTEDVSVPTETQIFYSKGVITFQIVFMLFALGFGIFLCVTASYIIGGIVCAFALFVIYLEANKAANKEPQIVLNSTGIQTKASGFVTWSNIQDDEVVTRQVGKTTVTYLEFNYTGGRFQLSIAELATNKTALENMLHTYRVRSEKKNTRETTI